MNLLRPLLALLLLTTTLSLAACSQTNENKVSRDARILTLRTGEHGLRLYNSSDTVSQCMAINESGAVIGVHETVDKTGAIFSLQHFYADDKQIHEIPILEGFTNVEATGLSDNGIVVGFAGRRVGHPDGSLAAMFWDSQTRELVRLPALPDDISCAAHDVSADGTVITGYSTGSEPARLRPCVWTVDAESKKWKPQVLSVIELMNPYLMSSHAIVSPDGKTIAACITEEFLPNGIVDSSLYLWERTGDQWQRKKFSSEQMRLHGMNDHGVIAGELSSKGQRVPCVVNADGDVVMIDLLPGDVSGAASDVNNQGVVVGYSDDPAGPEGGPQPIMWKDGKTSLLALREGEVFGMANGINEQGHIVGMADFELPAPDKAADEEPLVKSLGFVRTKVQ